MWALDVGLRLAVDISHLHLQRCAGVLDSGVERRLLGSPLVEEVHVSANDGRRDQHRPLTADTSGLAWARERLQGGTPTVLECTMHRLSTMERQRQLAILRGEA